MLKIKNKKKNVNQSKVKTKTNHIHGLAWSTQVNNLQLN